MANILICVPSTREYKPFLESFDNFVREISNKHNICVFFVRNKRLVDVQNEAAESFMAGNWDYLLFMDDDHWGHKPEMLDCLINANAYMATIKTYIRHYPYMCAILNRLPSGLNAGIEDGQGYVECDMTGFPMTLIRKDLFRKLDKPYFREQIEGVREWATDGDFCDRIRNVGVRPVGCFQHCLPHGDLTQENVLIKRLEDGKSTDNQMVDFIYGKFKGELCGANQPEQ